VLAGTPAGTAITNSVRVTDLRTGDTNDVAADSLTVTAAPPPPANRNDSGVLPAVRAALPLTGSNAGAELILGGASLVIGMVLLGIARALPRRVD